MILIAMMLLTVAAASWLVNGTIDVPFFVTPTVMLLVLLSAPRMQARQLYRLADAAGECRTVVDASGITVTNQQQTSMQSWQALANYAETPRVFVLFSNDKNASCLTILPKRGAPGADAVDRLRAVFDQHLTRA